MKDDVKRAEQFFIKEEVKKFQGRLEARRRTLFTLLYVSRAALWYIVATKRWRDLCVEELQPFLCMNSVCWPNQAYFFKQSLFHCYWFTSFSNTLRMNRDIYQNEALVVCQASCRYYFKSRAICDLFGQQRNLCVTLITIINFSLYYLGSHWRPRCHCCPQARLWDRGQGERVHRQPEGSSYWCIGLLAVAGGEGAREGADGAW